MVTASLPESTVKPEGPSFRISSTCPCCGSLPSRPHVSMAARRTIGSGSMFTPVRPCTLYNTYGQSDRGGDGHISAGTGLPGFVVLVVHAAAGAPPPGWPAPNVCRPFPLETPAPAAGLAIQVPDGDEVLRALLSATTPAKSESRRAYGRVTVWPLLQRVDPSGTGCAIRLAAPEQQGLAAGQSRRAPRFG